MNQRPNINGHLVQKLSSGHAHSVPTALSGH